VGWARSALHRLSERPDLNPRENVSDRRAAEADAESDPAASPAPRAEGAVPGAEIGERGSESLPSAASSAARGAGDPTGTGGDPSVSHTGTSERSTVFESVPSQAELEPMRGDAEVGWVAGRYRILDELGRGGMGRVYRVRDTLLGDRVVALKRLLASGPRLARRFQREAEVIARLSHRHIRTIYDKGRDQGGLYLVMEYVEGATLRDRVQDRGPLAEPELLVIARALADALRYAHERGVVHRDVKPSNVLLAEEGEIKLADFGLARRNHGEDATMTAQGLGTPNYAAPEQRALASSADERSDVFGLGATLYYAATGESPQTVRAERVPENWRELILRCLEDEPGRRPQSASEVLDLLDELDPRQVPGMDSRVELICKACYHPNPTEAEFCRRCGKGLYADCPECGSKEPRSARYCSSCGTDMPSRERARTRLERARSMVQAGSLEDALAEARTAAAIDRGWDLARQEVKDLERRHTGALNWLDEARRLEVARDFEGAERAWRRVLDHHPRHAEAIEALEALGQRALRRRLRAVENHLEAFDLTGAERDVRKLGAMGLGSEQVQRLRMRIAEREAYRTASEALDRGEWETVAQVLATHARGDAAERALWSRLLLARDRKRDAVEAEAREALDEHLSRGQLELAGVDLARLGELRPAPDDLPQLRQAIESRRKRRRWSRTAFTVGVLALSFGAVPLAAGGLLRVANYQRLLTAESALEEGDLRAAAANLPPADSAEGNEGLLGLLEGPRPRAYALAPRVEEATDVLERLAASDLPLALTAGLSSSLADWCLADPDSTEGSRDHLRDLIVGVAQTAVLGRLSAGLDGGDFESQLALAERRARAFEEVLAKDGAAAYLRLAIAWSRWFEEAGFLAQAKIRSQLTEGGDPAVLGDAVMELLRARVTSGSGPDLEALESMDDRLRSGQLRSLEGRRFATREAEMDLLQDWRAAWDALQELERTADGTPWATTVRRIRRELRERPESWEATREELLSELFAKLVDGLTLRQRAAAEAARDALVVMGPHRLPPLFDDPQWAQLLADDRDDFREVAACVQRLDQLKAELSALPSRAIPEHEAEKSLVAWCERRRELLDASLRGRLHLAGGVSEVSPAGDFVFRLGEAPEKALLDGTGFPLSRVSGERWSLALDQGWIERLSRAAEPVEATLQVHLAGRVSSARYSLWIDRQGPRLSFAADLVRDGSDFVVQLSELDLDEPAHLSAARLRDSRRDYESGARGLEPQGLDLEPGTETLELRFAGPEHAWLELEPRIELEIADAHGNVTRYAGSELGTLVSERGARRLAMADLPDADLGEWVREFGGLLAEPTSARELEFDFERVITTARKVWEADLEDLLRPGLTLESGSRSGLRVVSVSSWEQALRRIEDLLVDLQTLPAGFAGEERAGFEQQLQRRRVDLERLIDLGDSRRDFDSVDLVADVGELRRLATQGYPTLPIQTWLLFLHGQPAEVRQRIVVPNDWAVVRADDWPGGSTHRLRGYVPPRIVLRFGPPNGAVEVAFGLCFPTSPASGDPQPLYVAHTELSQAAFAESPEWGSLPQANVSQVDALAWCLDRGLDLPTEAEWLHAAGAALPGRSVRPAGHTWDRGARSAVSVDEAELGGVHEAFRGFVGNVAEWCLEARHPLRTAWYAVDGGDSPTRLPGIDNASDANFWSGTRVVRGSSWRQFLADARPDRTLSYDAGQALPFVGFRPVLRIR
jgi:hypothetical protein